MVSVTMIGLACITENEVFDGKSPTILAAIVALFVAPAISSTGVSGSDRPALTEAIYSANTVWPTGFDPILAGAIDLTVIVTPAP